MLSRTADNLFWMGRYMERAETMARLLEVGARINLMPDANTGYRTEWSSILHSSGTEPGFTRKYRDPVERNVVSHLFFDRENPSSVASCIAMARENARIVRTALSSAVWDAINTSFQEFKQLERVERSEIEVSELTDWTFRRAAQVQGAIWGTLLRNDGFDFLNLGYHLERADNTARLLDVKYYVLLPDAGYVGTGLDNFQWMTLLRSIQMHRAFHWAYGGDITPAKIVDFLILNAQCPRSLRTAVQGANDHLDNLARGYGASTAAQSHVRRLLAQLWEVQPSDIFEEGLHEFLNRFKADIAGVASEIQGSYLRGTI
jgi:uncharacterized alpha-E superfamily protein